MEPSVAKDIILIIRFIIENDRVDKNHTNAEYWEVAITSNGELENNQKRGYYWDAGNLLTAKSIVTACLSLGINFNKEKHLSLFKPESDDSYLFTKYITLSFKGVL